MPSTRPCAAFEPISPDFDVYNLVESTPNFEWVVRINCDMIDHQGVEAFEKLVLIHVILGGKPLVVDGYERRLDRWTFAVQWLRDNLGSKVENPRDLTKKVSVPMTFAHYLNHMALLTNQWTPQNYKDPERQRIYMKDIDCPQLWHNKLQTVLPPFLYYLNETTGDTGGFGSTDEPDPSGSGFRRGKGIAKSGDLMSCLPKETRAENMMCYIGHEGTYTPSHREMCASLGQNIMVEASNGLVEDGKPTRPGSSLWFMTENKEREVVAEYWLSRLGHDIEVENHFAQINAWKNAPFKTYVVEQKPGDLILIPPLAPHQVWNRGTRTMKVAWNRTTVETLEMALNEALPKARMVCRDEQYKNKAMIYFALQKYSRLLKMAEKHKQARTSSNKKPKSDTKVRQLEKDFRRLHGLYTQLLIAESFLPLQQDKCEMVPFEGFITCSYCRCNIFNRFLTCSSCIIKGGDEEDTYDICLECYAMGRSCACISKLKWVEQFPWLELTQRHEAWRHQILAYEGKVTEKSPMSMKVELQRMGRKRTLAQICQLELKKRPFRDIKKPQPQAEGVDHEEEVEIDINGNIKKKKKKVRRSEKFVREHARCHVDGYWEPKWKQAECITCGKSYCFGTLFRAYDMLPQDILADPDWICPSCRGFCSCRTCRKKPGYKLYTPTGTRLGHNTKAVADARSVESLVDFSFSNIGWIQKAGDDTSDNTRRLNNRRREADAAQAQDTQLGEDYVDEDAERDGTEDGLLRLAEQEGIPIDPSLSAGNGALRSTPSDFDEDAFEENPEARREPDFGMNIMAPQFVIPEGGILRDAEHTYDFTDAITYDYPDPSMLLPAPVVVADEPESGHGNVLADPEDDHIEMVSRKRKRNKIDEGEKSFVYRKTNPAKPKKKQRKSLIVKLIIDKEKLAEVQRMAAVAQQALDGTLPAAPAPVVGSDLQALNTSYPSIEGQPPPSKKARIDQIVVERDDEYAPSRRRDRRKVPEGERLPPREEDITRRTTRTQAVTYEEPADEEEFDEVVDPKTSTTSKLATMENAIDIDDIDDTDDDSGSNAGPSSNSIVDRAVTADDVMDVDSSRPVSRASADGSEPEQATKVTTAVLKPQSTVSQKTMTRVAPANKPDERKALAQAAANRQVKLAVLNGEDDLSDGFDEEFSEAEDESVHALRDSRPVSRTESSSQSPAPSKPSSVAPPPVVVSNGASKTGSLAPRPKAAVSTNLISSNIKPAVSLSRSAGLIASSKSKLAVTEGDWSDSDSDESSIVVASKAAMATAVPRTSGWASINGNGSKGNHFGGIKPGVAKRGRGRPPLKR